jgi:hypothetical protein
MPQANKHFSIPFALSRTKDSSRLALVAVGSAIKSSLSSSTMPKANGGSTGPLVEFLRLTAFVHPEERLTEPTWWSDLTGGQPEQRTSKPGRGEFQETGPIGETFLSLSLQAGRVDWFLTPGPFEATADLVVKIASIGTFPEKFGDFVGLMSRWLAVSPRITRLAFGGVVLVPVESKEAGYRKLSEYLSAVKIDADSSEDFLYQINRPRTSASGGGLRINRLSKWSVAYFQRFRVGIPAPSLQAQGTTGDRVHACRIELDISTPAESSGDIHHDRLADVFRELVNFGSEIAQKGDIA